MRPASSFARLARFGGLAATLFAFAPLARAHGVDEEDLGRFIGGGPLVYFDLGAKHMLTGYDHLLFLFGAVFYVRRLVEIVKLVSLFTLGHSITLFAATYWQIQANPWLIDAVVALTVIYKAFDNLDGFPRWIGVPAPKVSVVVVIIGLLHGFGLSTRLQEVPLGSQGLWLRILAFNAGVEVGQLAALLVLGLLLAAWRRRPSFERFGKLTNSALLIAGVLLLLFQLHGYVHFAHAEDFPLNEHAHEHLHEEIAGAQEEAGG